MLADGARRWRVCVCVCVKGREERRIDGMHVRRCVGTMDGWVFSAVRGPQRPHGEARVGGSESEIREVTEW